VKLGAAFRAGEFVNPDEANVSSFDLGLFNSDSVYDVISVWRRRFFMLDEHLERFSHSAATWNLEIPHDRGEVGRILAELVDRAGLEDAYVKVQLTRGRPPPPSRDPRDADPLFIALAIPYVWLWGERRCREGGSLHVSSIERISTRAVASRVKNYCRADFVQSQFEAYEHGCDDAVLLGPDGNLTEGIGWNVLLVHGGAISSPRDNVLPGITRAAVGEICAEMGIPFELRPLGLADLESAEEIFLSSTAGGVLPVLSVDGRDVGNGAAGPLTERIQAEYWQRRKEGWHGTDVSGLLGVRAQ
jgi:branched-chain amino acid aminotransferase